MTKTFELPPRTPARRYRRAFPHPETQTERYCSGLCKVMRPKVDFRVLGAAGLATRCYACERLERAWKI